MVHLWDLAPGSSGQGSTVQLGVQNDELGPKASVQGPEALPAKPMCKCTKPLSRAAAAAPRRWRRRGECKAGAFIKGAATERRHAPERAQGATIWDPLLVYLEHLPRSAKHGRLRRDQRTPRLPTSLPWTWSYLPRSPDQHHLLGSPDGVPLLVR